MTHIAPIRKFVDDMAFKGDHIVYLPRDDTVKKTIHVGKRLDQPVDTVLPSAIVHHFIDQASFIWRMNFCVCRLSSDCKDYPIDYGCLFMGEAARGINPEWGREITREEAHEYIKKCGEAGLVHMIGRNKIDTLWLGVGPGEKLLTVCNCCPCCCLWKMLPDIDSEIGRKIMRLPGVHVEVTDDCVGCGICTDGVCFVDAIQLVNGRAVISDMCRGCGRCVEVCPQEAIKLTIEDDYSVNRTIQDFTELVDIG
ncbi:MAG: DUF362 domain-containing protein [Candidatus Thorarchaeota archaeon]